MGTLLSFLQVMRLPVVGAWPLNCLVVSQMGACKGALGLECPGTMFVVCGYGGSE